ncbi:signal recognition particle-docking protein FtsY [Eubacterium callanderi]|uniref:Signal recognition particle receptor FtsY n=1 Tax=Eubacterium callanderi TaxID=53442 RepID=A0A853JLD3_9FIRM|nr:MULTISPECIES: signal recognition particle-docking protein FtsY [Eubacterium]MBS4858759.1 signal recognition particle-docking protein FtsY [Eubacterium limosum]MDR4073952.1 signal recognition particle-docking protein FtsY [Eubacterium sp.]MBO1700676.1 signal recognition particle-docking protein FtsY [Eubacterium callanderi]MBV1683835.1 signal recognition particle-docking protein FtsY [Eubacterium callanderi]MCB6660581.1 signal recognition particle-docking protein FtsY [Eubacterium callanderi
MTLYERMCQKLKKTKDSFIQKVENVVYYGDLDDDFFDELEETFILSDLGIETATKITETLREQIKETKTKAKQDVMDLLRQIMTEMVEVEKHQTELPVIMLVVGVNGVGKTTTIAKLAQKYKDQGKKVMVAAADTFRAAAAEQLDVWADRVGVDIIKSVQGADPSSVVFDAIGAARARGADILLCDTAGRLHNKVNLMKELEKITRVVEREGQGFSVHNLLVLDATTGQNALNQAKTFNDAVHLDGIVMTKMDGTAKGGVAIAIIDELQVPIEYVGIGEKPEDLIDFDAGEFVRMLYEGGGQNEEMED